MDFTLQKRLAADVMNCSKKRVWFDSSSMDKIKEAITKADIKGLVSMGIIREKPKRGISRARANKILVQKRKGRQRGHGSRKGKAGARLPTKGMWINKIRLQREFLKELKDKKIIDSKTYRDLYLKSKSGTFRSKRHVKLYMEEN